ncbi:hypothetical protein GCM10028857_15830 [Salinarchaeum chitinilyticum]
MEEEPRVDDWLDVRVHVVPCMWVNPQGGRERERGAYEHEQPNDPSTVAQRFQTAGRIA